MVKSSKKIEDIEIIKPNIIKGFDLSLTLSTEGVLDKDKFLLSLYLLRRFEKGLFTTEHIKKFINLIF